MKVFRKILYVLAGIFVLLTVFIIICAYNPGLTEKLQGVIYKGKTVEVSKINDMAASGEASDPNAISENSVAQTEQRMRSLEELGVSEDALINDLEAYYQNCHDQIVQRGAGDYAFENFIATETLVQEIYSKYSNKEYVEGYMDQALADIGAASYHMNLLVEELTDKHYRLTHQVVIN